MTVSVSIIDTPSTNGASQTRDIGVSIEAPDEASDGEIVVLLDATQNGSFREIDSQTRRFSANETASVTLEPFIGAQPPYDLRVEVLFVDTFDKDQDTVTVSQEQAPTPDEVSADDFDIDSETAVVRGGDAVDVTPRIGPIEPIVLDAEYQLPWDRDNNQTACGQTIQNQNGDFNWRIVFSGVLTLTQLDQLRALRRRADAVETRSAVFGVRSVNFDQLNLTRSQNPSVINVNGTIEPIYEFQLQTKELDEQTSDGLFGDN